MNKHVGIFIVQGSFVFQGQKSKKRAGGSENTNRSQRNTQKSLAIINADQSKALSLRMLF